ncbi:MAG: MerR family transcriptional regulator [Phycisphaeraceae bacterium]
MPRKLDRVLAEIRAAAEVLGGEKAVPRPRVLAALEMRDTRGPDIERYHGMPRLVRPARPGESGHPRRVYWPLDAVERFARHWLSERSQRRWTRRELDQVYRQLGRQRLEVIAASLGRSVRALKDVMARQGWTEHGVILDREGLLSTHQLARICGVTASCVRKWRDQGAPCIASEASHGQHYYRLRDIRRWLRGRPETLIHLRPDVLRRLHIDLARVMEEQAA